MDPTLKTQIQAMIDEAVKRSESFSNRKRGDTPTDADQLTPKGYLLGQVSSVQSSVTSYVTSVVASVNGTISALTSVIAGLSASVAALPTLDEMPNTHFASVQSSNAFNVGTGSPPWTFSNLNNSYANGAQSQTSGGTTAFAPITAVFDAAPYILKATVATDTFTSGGNNRYSFWGFSGGTTSTAFGDITNVALRYGFAFNSSVIYALCADGVTASSTNVYAGYNGETVELGIVKRAGATDFYIGGVLIRTETGSNGGAPLRISATTNSGDGSTTSIFYGNIVLGGKYP